MYTIQKNVENFFSWSQARNVQSMADVYDYFDAFISTTYSLSNALIDATTLDVVAPKKCLKADGICMSPIWRAHPTSNLTDINKLMDMKVAKIPAATGPHTLLFNKKGTSVFAPPQILFSEAMFSSATMSVSSLPCTRTSVSPMSVSHRS